MNTSKPSKSALSSPDGVLLKGDLRPLHDPFVPRKLIGLFSAIPAIASAIYFRNPWVGGLLYAVGVTLLDLGSHYILKIKPSRGVDAVKLLASEGVTSEEFDAYFVTRCWIRVASLSTALVSGALAFALLPQATLKTFCVTYVVSTFLGILWVRYISQIPRPKLLHRDDRFYRPRLGPRPGHIYPEMIPVYRALGLEAPVDHS